ncbi:PadR family transcriptional regulator [Bacillus changyiensis]|uniref:PadR family transcriptional regulator n=1 Tax=Bacillus changyiensis TaxID=3004103 RepID=UPI0022E03693|nr:helix-turn-helix transcriptional regulator [Bacillus changyiensis]MDA1476961.1 helix-turn-helix transcriptional regulator [Bacillus changyiensis]
MNFDKSLVAGSTMLLVLHLLDNQDMYGYQIVKELEKRSESTFTLKEGTLYPILHSLEKNGLAVSYMSAGESGRKRKYYQITKSGKKQLADKKEEWLIFTRTVNKVIGGSRFA